MKLKVNIRDHLEGATDHNGELHVSACLDLEDLFAGNDIPEEQEIDVDIGELLAEDRKIAHIWGVADVQTVRPDLDDNAAWDVLQSVRDDLDSKHGITWDTIEHAANQLYPRKMERHWRGRIDVRITDTDGYGENEVLTRLRDMAELLAKDMPGVTADVDPGSVQLLDPDETAGKQGRRP
jgi:hypothetical protein